MSEPTTRPVEVSLVLYRIYQMLVGTAVAEDDLDGARAAATVELVAIVSGAVYTSILPEVLPVRGLLVRAAIVPGGLRTSPARAATGYHVVPPLQLMAFCEASERDPYRTLDQIQTAAFLVTQGASVGWPDRTGAAMALYRTAEPTSPEAMGNDRHVFSTATLTCGLYSLAAASVTPG